MYSKENNFLKKINEQSQWPNAATSSHLTCVQLKLQKKKEETMGKKNKPAIYSTGNPQLIDTWKDEQLD